MSQLTDEFIYLLLKNGKTENEASDILSDIIVEAFDELYKAKNFKEKEDLELNSKLQYLLDTGASNENLYQTLGISPLDFHNKLKEKITEYVENKK